MNDYLQKTTLKDTDVKKGVRQYLKNMRIVTLLTIAVVLAGFVSYKSLPQTVAPEINLTLLVVSASLPGATPEDVESLLTIPIEDELKSVEGIDTINATAASSVTSIVMQFVRGVDKNRALADVEAALGRIADLPEDATEPRVEAVNFEDSPVVQWIFASDSESATSISAQIQKLVDTLESSQKIDRVVTGGKPTQEVQILITPEILSAYSLTVNSIRSAVVSGVSSLPSGTVEGVHIKRSVSIDASIGDVADIRALPITLPGTGQIISLGDIATIIERPEPGNTNAYLRADGKTSRAISLDVYRTSGVDISDAVEVAERTAADFMEKDGVGLTRYENFNADTELSTQFKDLMRNLATTVVLVFITLTLFVGRRQALLAAISIPLIYAIAFIAMGLTGVSVNFLSLFSLMISLGLLVDVTIVIVSAMTTYMREGSFGSHKTGVLVFRDFFVTLIMTTLTTVWAFVPLLLAGGIIGEYIKPIPVVVSSVLVGSVLVGFFVILPLMIWLFDFSLPRRVLVLLRLSIFVGIFAFFMGVVGLMPLFALLAAAAFTMALAAARHLYQKLNAWRRQRKIDRGVVLPDKDMPQTIIDISSLQARYRNILERILATRTNRWKVIAMVAILFVFAVTLVAKDFVKMEFFPGDDNHYLYVEARMPDGTTAQRSEVLTTGLFETLSAVPGVSYVTMQVGFGASGDGGTSRSGGEDVLFTLKTPQTGEGARGSAVIADELRKMPAILEFDAGDISVSEVEGGPPAGADVTVTFVGAELDVLRSLAQTLTDELENARIESGVTQINKYQLENIDISPASAAAIIAFEPDDYTLAREEISRGEISSTIRLLTAGVTLADDVELSGLSDKRDIVLRMQGGEASLEDIGRIRINTSRGEYPLDALGSVTLRENITEVSREEYDRTVSVTAGILDGHELAKENEKIAKFINENIDLPAGYSWKTGGANEENNESVTSIIQGMGLAAALIFLTLIIHLRSYRKAAIVLLTVPLAISGVFVIFGLTGIALTFPALIGLLALFGIVVNNAIIIIAQINANREVGLSFHDAVVSGATSRLEPILLSTLTTIIGLLPITLSDPIWQGLGGAIIAGLTFSGVIMLLFIPTVYYIMMSDEDTDRIE